MTYLKLAAFALGATVAFAIVLLLSGCASTPALGELGTDQQILDTCPKSPNGDHLAVDEEVFPDSTTTSAAPAIDDERLGIIEKLVRRAVVCGGRISIAAFSSSSGATVPIYDEVIALPGATDNARLLQVPKKTASVMETVRANYAVAIKAPAPGGTDVVGLYRLIGERQAQDPGRVLEATILTDGLNNIGVNTEHTLTADQATTLASTVTVPQLPGAAVKVAGLGRVASGVVPSDTIAGLVAFYDAVCKNTGAATCSSVTDWR